MEEPMKRAAISIAVAALMGAGIAMAQTSPPSSPPPARSTYPSTNSSTTATQSSSTTTTNKSPKQQMKDCMDSQKASNPNESKSDMKKYCKSQVESSPHP
jgi:hypothetical protein